MHAADLDEVLDHGVDRDIIVVKANAACETFDMMSGHDAGRKAARK